MSRYGSLLIALMLGQYAAAGIGADTDPAAAEY